MMSTTLEQYLCEENDRLAAENTRLTQELEAAREALIEACGIICGDCAMLPEYWNLVRNGERWEHHGTSIKGENYITPCDASAVHDLWRTLAQGASNHINQTKNAAQSER